MVIGNESSPMTGNKLLSMAFADLSQTVGKSVVMEIHTPNILILKKYIANTFPCNESTQIYSVCMFVFFAIKITLDKKSSTSWFGLCQDSW